MNIDLTSQLRDWQKDFFTNAKKFNVLVIHRRAWKTVISILFLIYKALSVPWDYWYIAPYRSQAKSIAWWKYIKKYINAINNQITKIEKKKWKLESDIKRKLITINNSELIVTFPNSSTIRLFWTDNQDALRWLDLMWVVLDEYAQMSNTVYDEILYPMLLAHWDKAFTVWIWTPEWKNIFYDVYQKWLNDERYYTTCLDVYKTWIFSEDDIQDAKITMEEDAFKQELLVDWDVAIKGSYYWKAIEKIRNEWHMIPDLYDKNYSVYTSWDLWMNDSMVILFFQYIEWTIRIIDEFDDRWQWFPYYKDIIYSKPYTYKMHFLPHDIMVQEMWTWLTRLETFERLFKEEAQKLTRHWLEDWINMVRELIPKMYFDTSLEDYLNILTEYRPTYNQKSWKFWKPIHCDFSDAIRYLASAHNYYVQNFEEYDHFTVQYDNLLY